MLFIVKKTAAEIVETKNNYVIQAKVNQSALYNNLKKNAESIVPRDSIIEIEKQKGRKETREISIYDNGVKCFYQYLERL